jgi:16S rRNA (adenine1518-N6/adenine1519-N6)-dimethyltransferase
VCANLPYYITTPILMKLLESGLPFHNITVMIQSEVADRLCSPVGGKDCGAITAVLNYYGVAERLFVVPASDFLPPPSVNSAVVRIRLHDEKPFVPKNDELFRKTIRVAFEQRRKTLPNALQAGFGNLSKEDCIAAAERAGLRPDIRGERLTMENFIALSDILDEMMAGAAQ